VAGGLHKFAFILIYNVFLVISLPPSVVYVGRLSGVNIETLTSYANVCTNASFAELTTTDLAVELMVKALLIGSLGALS